MDTIQTQYFTFANGTDDPFILQNGDVLGSVTLAYQTYGVLNADRTNAILVFHALTGSQHLAGYNPGDEQALGALWTDECKTGWWDNFVGPGKSLDTNQFFVICANYLGGCYGSTGPLSINPATGTPYGASFPSVRANDIVDSQMRLLNHLGVDKLHAVVGGSLGGMLAINMSIRYAARMNNVILIASGMEVTVLQRLHNFEQIMAIEEDASFNQGNYDITSGSLRGLALARMISHKTFVSLSTIERRARTDIKRDRPSGGFYRMNFPIESYMQHQGQKFAQRFDANSYLRIINVWQQFDLYQDSGALHAEDLFEPCRQLRFLVISIDSDVCFYCDDQAYMVNQLEKNHVPCQYITVHSDKGHDSFLIEPELYAPQIEYMLRDERI
ncbi:MAG: homoserine O-acetyltransferase [Spartobacteria bacterium]|nr:homoserine O-acetyltransferase [Spartobacteria bacterium]